MFTWLKLWWLKRKLHNKDWRVRSDAARALGELGDSRAVEPLVAVLRDSTIGVRSSAAEALGRLGVARAVEPLLAALKDSDSIVRRNAADALLALGWHPSNAEQRVALAIATHKFDQCVVEGKVAVEPLLAALKDSYSRIGDSAIETLAKLGDLRAVEPLLAALKDSGYNTRRKAAEALGILGDARAVEPLLVALKDSASAVRNEVVQGLRTGSSREPITAWCALRDEAVQALRKLGNARAVQPLVVLATSDSNVAAVVMGVVQYILEKASGQVPSETLHAVADVKDIFQIRRSDSCVMEWVSVPVDCSQVKQLARQELIRRGLKA